MDIFIYRDGKISGPFTREQVGEHLANGNLNENDKACENDLAWSRGFRDWQPLRSIISRATSLLLISKLKPEDSSEPLQNSLSSRNTGSFYWLRPKLIATWSELAVILTLTTGYYICSSTAVVIQRWRGFSPVLHSINYHCLHSLATEGSILTLLLFFLHLRGWTTTDLKIKPDLKGSREGLSLAIAALMIAGSTVRIVNVLLGGTHSVHVVGMAHPHSNISHANWILILVLCAQTGPGTNTLLKTDPGLPSLYASERSADLRSHFWGKVRAVVALRINLRRYRNGWNSSPCCFASCNFATNAATAR